MNKLEQFAQASPTVRELVNENKALKEELNNLKGFLEELGSLINKYNITLNWPSVLPSSILYGFAAHATTCRACKELVDVDTPNPHNGLCAACMARK
jgi:hypothetical protein